MKDENEGPVLETVRCAWEVTAGVVPGRKEDEHTRQFVMTTPMPDERFAELQEEALAYAKTLMDPRYLNWVSVDWIWL